MLAPQKRRRISYYLSLPLVVAILFGLVAKLAALQRAEVIAELADRVAHREAADAAAAVRHLAAMPRPPVTILVMAATSTDREVADEAKQSIGKVLRRLQRQIEAEQRLGAASQQLTELAEALAKQQPMFSTADHPWLAGTTRKVLRLSNRMPPRHAPSVALHCDAVLAAVLPQDEATAEVAARDVVPAEPAVVVPASDIDSLPPRQARREQDVSAVSTRPFDTTPVSGDIHSDRQPSELARAADGPVASAASSIVPARPPWQATWSHPIFHMVPAMPVEPLPEDDDVTPIDASEPSRSDERPSDVTPVGSPLAQVNSRELLQRWLSAEGAELVPIEHELARRGFGRVPERLVRALFSPATEDRLRLVDAVVTEPHLDARPWLMLLADDPHAEVRWLAVTIMATSKEAALIEKAWMVAIHDRDPRIAGLAGRLRERRDDALRR